MKHNTMQSSSYEYLNINKGKMSKMSKKNESEHTTVAAILVIV